MKKEARERVAYGTYIITYFKNNWYYCIIYSGACFTYFVFFPITYVGKANGNIEEKKITGNIRAGWLFHLLHCRLWIENTEIHYNIRLLGIKIKIF